MTDEKTHNLIYVANGNLIYEWSMIEIQVTVKARSYDKSNVTKVNKIKFCKETLSKSCSYTTLL